MSVQENAEIINFADLQLARAYYDAWVERNSQALAGKTLRQKKQERKKMMATIVGDSFVMSKLRNHSQRESIV